jgi:hypothetical protein
MALSPERQWWRRLARGAGTRAVREAAVPSLAWRVTRTRNRRIETPERTRLRQVYGRRALTSVERQRATTVRPRLTLIRINPERRETTRT